MSFYSAIQSTTSSESFFLSISRPRSATPFPTRRSSDLFGLTGVVLGAGWFSTGFRAWLLAIDESRGKQIGRAHGLNSSHSQISYAVFCLKKKNSYLDPCDAEQNDYEDDQTRNHRPHDSA